MSSWSFGLVGCVLMLSCGGESARDAGKGSPSTEVEPKPKPEPKPESEPEPEPEPEPEAEPEPLPRPERPAIDELSAFVDENGALGVAFEGRVGAGPVRVIHVELLDDTGEVIQAFSSWFQSLGRPNRFLTTASVAHLEADADTFRGFTTRVDSSWTSSPRRVRVALGERSELMGEPVEVDVDVAAPKLVEVGAACDPFEVVSRCGEGVWCDVPDGVGGDSPTCLEPVESCPFDVPTLEGTYAGSNASAPDRTLASCTRSRGNAGSEQAHAFVAPAAGTFRFTAAPVRAGSSAVLTLFVRSHCQYAHANAELGCVHQVDGGADPNQPLSEGPLTLDVALSAGERVFVFVESWWAIGGDYTLAVTALD